MSEPTQQKSQMQVTPTTPNDSPISSDAIIPTLIMLGIGMLGGLAQFWSKVRAGEVRMFNFVELIGEMFVSGVAGVLAYWLMKGFGINPYLTAAGVGIAGHMGSRFLFIAEKWFESKIPHSRENARRKGDPQ